MMGAGPIPCVTTGQEPLSNRHGAGTSRVCGGSLPLLQKFGNALVPYLTLMTLDAPQRTHNLRDVFDGLRPMVCAGAG